MTNDEIRKIIASAEVCKDDNAPCGGCIYQYAAGNCRKILFDKLLSALKAVYKPQNSPIDEEKGAEPINVLAPIKSPSEGAFEALWTEGGEERKLRFTDMENATIFTDLLLNAKRNVGEVTIRRMAW